ncbi:hypothetical protein D3C85_1490330 [compost metagenome]
MLHRLDAIVPRGLPSRRQRKEEARVEALRQAGRRQPVAAIGQLVHCEAHAQPFADMGDARAAIAGGFAQAAVGVGVECIEIHILAIGIAGE